MIPMWPQISQCAAMRRDDICIYVSPANRARLDGDHRGSQQPSEGGVARRDRAGDGRRATAPTRSCGARASRSRACGAGRSAISRRASTACCATRRGRPRKKPLSADGEAASADEDGQRDAAERDALEPRFDGGRDGHQPVAACGASGPRRASSRISCARFKVSNDPQFEEKVTDVVGLYMNPPDRALVLCVDEKSQIQALDRTQPGLPMKKGRAATMTHDYKRHGTTTLFAALDVKSGIVIGECQPRHRAKEFIRFLKRIDRCVKKHLDLHLVLDNYGDAQDARGEGVARQASALQAALHADQRVLAQSRRALLRRDHDQAHPARRLQQRRRVGGGDPRLSRPPQRRPQALRLDQIRRAILEKEARARAAMEAVKSGTKFRLGALDWHRCGCSSLDLKWAWPPRIPPDVLASCSPLHLGLKGQDSRTRDQSF